MDRNDGVFCCLYNIYCFVFYFDEFFFAFILIVYDTGYLFHAFLLEYFHSLYLFSSCKKFWFCFFGEFLEDAEIWVLFFDEFFDGCQISFVEKLVKDWLSLYCSSSSWSEFHVSIESYVSCEYFHRGAFMVLSKRLSYFFWFYGKRLYLQFFSSLLYFYSKSLL